MTAVPSMAAADVPDPLPAHTTILDVREQEEWDAGHVAGAVHLPMSQLAHRVGEVPEGRVLVMCKVGGRSAQIAAWLAPQGHDVVNISGGMLEWQAAQRPMVSEDGGAPRIV